MTRRKSESAIKKVNTLPFILSVLKSLLNEIIITKDKDTNILLYSMMEMSFLIKGVARMISICIGLSMSTSTTLFECWVICFINLIAE